MPDRTFDQFVSDVRALLEPTASGKGYSTTGVDGHNALYEFVQSFAGSHHAEGEIVYKVKRFAAKGNIEDILKAAAWAFLIYKHHESAVHSAEPLDERARPLCGLPAGVLDHRRSGG